MALPNPTSSTLPSLCSPSTVSISTSSSNDAVVTPSIIISGPLSSPTFVYSIPTDDDVVVISGNYLRLLLLFCHCCCCTTTTLSCGSLTKLFVYLPV